MIIIEKTLNVNHKGMQKKTEVSLPSSARYKRVLYALERTKQKIKLRYNLEA